MSLAPRVPADLIDQAASVFSDYLRSENSLYIWLDDGGAVVHVSPRAQKVLFTEFGGSLGLPSPAPGGKHALTLVKAGPLTLFALRLPAGVLLVLPEPAEPPRSPRRLTRRQRQVLHWLAQGKANAEIGELLGISPRTVERHCAALFIRIGVENRMSAALWAAEQRHAVPPKNDT